MCILHSTIPDHLRTAITFFIAKKNLVCIKFICANPAKVFKLVLLAVWEEIELFSPFYNVSVANMYTVAIAQNSGGVKLWQIDHFRVLARKTLANLQLYISHFSESGIWLGKILANDVLFAKFAKVFPRQNFVLYGNKSISCVKTYYIH